MKKKYIPRKPARLLKAWDWMLKWQKKNYLPPNIREIAQHEFRSISKVSQAHNLVACMQKVNMLVKVPMRANGIRLLPRRLWRKDFIEMIGESE